MVATDSGMLMPPNLFMRDYYPVDEAHVRDNAANEAVCKVAASPLPFQGEEKGRQGDIRQVELRDWRLADDQQRARQHGEAVEADIFICRKFVAYP